MPLNNLSSATYQLRKDKRGQATFSCLMINKSIYQSPWNPGHISESSLQFSLSPFTPHIQNWQLYLTPRSPCSVDIHSMISQAPPNNAQSRYNIAYTSLLNA